MAEQSAGVRRWFEGSLDKLSGLGIGLKFKIVFLLTGVVPLLGILVLLQNNDSSVLQNVLAIYIAVCIIFYHPFCKVIEELVVLRQTRRINAFVDEVKAGSKNPVMDLPDEKGNEHDFLRLKRNVFWMVQGLKRREAKLEHTLDQLNTAQRQVLESIEYASRIQRSFLPSRQDLSDALGEHFLIWQPRDGVGGDAYWVKEMNGFIILAVFDCTGHGVPGAFLTLIVNSLFEQNLDEHCLKNPARLLTKMNMNLKNALSQHGKDNLSDDGLEGAVCCIDKEAGILHFAGARGFLVLAGEKRVHKIRGDKSGVGFVRVPMDQKFANQTLSLDTFHAAYLFTDGITDQIGGRKTLPFGRRRLIGWIEENSDKPMDMQKNMLMDFFNNYKGHNTQRDDVTVLGFSAREFSC